MFVYNITIKVSWNIAPEWMYWQKNEHVPEIMATGLFDDHRIYRLLEQDDQEGPTYIFQYFTSSETRYQQYLRAFAPALREKAFQRWGDGFIAHRTIMERMD